MKKKILALVIVVIMILSGCSNNSQSGTNNESKAGNDSKQEVTLTYALWDANFQVAFQKAIDAFESIHPNIHVKIELTPWEQYWTKMNTATTGGSLTDLFWMNGPNSYKYISNDILMPITEPLKDEITNYPESLVGPYLKDDKVYAIPFEFATVGLWYNKKLFDEANVLYPDASWNWDKLRDTAKMLTDPAKGVWGIAAGNSDFANYYNTIVQSGGYVISDDKKTSGYDKSETIEGLKFWTNLIADGVSPTQAQMTETDPQTMFESGKVAMAYLGTWVVGGFVNNEFTKENTDVAPLPKGKTDASGIIHGTATAINAKTKHPKEALELLKFLASEDANEIFKEVGAFIPSYNGMQDGWVASAPEFHLQSYVDGITSTKPFPISKDTAKWNEVQYEYLNKAWAGQITIEDAAKQIAAKMNEILAQE